MQAVLVDLQRAICTQLCFHIFISFSFNELSDGNTNLDIASLRLLNREPPSPPPIHSSSFFPLAKEKKQRDVAFGQAYVPWLVNG